MPLWEHSPPAGPQMPRPLPDPGTSPPGEAADGAQASSRWFPGGVGECWPSRQTYQHMCHLRWNMWHSWTRTAPWSTWDIGPAFCRLPAIGPITFYGLLPCMHPSQCSAIVLPCCPERLCLPVPWIKNRPCWWRKTIWWASSTRAGDICWTLPMQRDRDHLHNECKGNLQHISQQSPRRSFNLLCATSHNSKLEDSGGLDRGGLMELYGLLSSEEENDPHRQETSPNGQNAGMGSGTTRVGAEPSPDPSVQVFEATDHQPQCGGYLPVAPADHWSTPATMGTSHFPEPFGTMATAVQSTEGPSVQIKPFGRILGAAFTRPIGETTSKACLTLRLQNDGNRCCQNANISAFLWGMLQRFNAHWADFEHGEEAFATLLTEGQYGTLVFESTGFEELQLVWGSHQRQEDAHEFTAVMLEWCQPFCLDVTWSRRLHVNDSVSTYDHGSRFMPPTLTIGASKKGTCSLQQLTDMWHDHGGMKTCFHQATDVLALHLDRLTRDHSGAPCRADWIVHLDPSVLIPFWNDEGTLCLHHREYVPVSVIFHSGTMEAGHLRAAALTQEGWHLTEDNRVALPDPTQLEVILKDIAVIWLVREDVLQLQPLPPPLWGKDDWVTKAVWYIFHRKYAQLKRDEDLLHIMRLYCADCGAPYFGAVCLHDHVKRRHEGFWPSLRQEYLRLMQALPCDLCLASFHPRGPWDITDREHVCPTVMNLCVACMHYGSALAPLGTRYNMPEADDEGMLRTPPLLRTLPELAADPVGAFLDALMR